MVEAKEFNVSFLKVMKAPQPKRANRAITHLHRFMKKHFRVEPENVKISEKVNEAIWEKGRVKIPKKLSIKVTEEKIKDKKLVNIYLQDEKIPVKEKPKKAVKPVKLSKEEKEKAEEVKKKLEEKKEIEKAAQGPM